MCSQRIHADLAPQTPARRPRRCEFEALEHRRLLCAVAFDMAASGSQNLVAHTNPFEGAFSSSGDGAQKYQRGVSASIPFSLLDDSLTFPNDALGIIGVGNGVEFFGVTDTRNPDNETGDVSAAWVFNIAGHEHLRLSIDLAAMGDFESSDVFTWTYQIEGGPVRTAFEGRVDPRRSQTYTLEGGGRFTLDDPLLVYGTVLTNELRTFTTAIDTDAGGVGLGGTELTLTLSANTDGGGEAFAFQNIFLRQTAGADVDPPLVVGRMPAEDASEVAIDGDLVLTFDEAVRLRRDGVRLRRASDAMVVEAIVSVQGDVVVIDPVGNLEFGTAYYVTVDDGAIEDLSGNPFAGISDAIAWNFTTSVLPPDSTPPTFSGAGPLAVSRHAAAGTVVGDVDADDGAGGDVGVRYAIVVGSEADASMMVGEPGYATTPLFTVGQPLPSTGALNSTSAGEYTPIGVLDGIGAFEIGDNVRV